ncbi:MAG TPA: fumarylacetoacetate hydrolase family protein [Syntrophales bacterium]|nr:fumarylacetoacetate hydrolase family protein [Syntrophales bacterium]
MKIIRFLSDMNEPLYGVFDPAAPDKARIIEGNILGKFSLSDRSAAVKKILPPIDPPNILALGFSYGKHASEAESRAPESPVLFIKGTNTLIGPGDTIFLPKAGPDEVDYEAELVIVIGKRAKSVSAKEAMDFILGYTCANDVSARDWQMVKQKKQWARGKSFDTFCPLGPYMVTKDEVPDPNSLRIRSILNGKVMQDSNTSDMLFSVAEIVSDLSQSMTLLPGTVILTGTPEGVGFVRKPPVFLQPGDVIAIAIDKLGELTNPVALEK